MQCVILAAGKGTRLRPLTETVPKPLVEVGGVPILDRIFNLLPSAITEVILVLGYKGDMIQKRYGEEYQGRKIRYITQEEQLGTGHALWLCKDYIKGRFLYMFADDLHAARDIARALSYVRSMLVYHTKYPERFGIVLRNPDGTLSEIVEKPKHPPSNLASTGVFVLDEHIFDFPPEKKTGDEFYHTDMIREYIKQHPMAVVEQDVWLPIGYPEDIETAAKQLHMLE